MDAALVDQIVQQVMAALRQQGMAAPAPAAPKPAAPKVAAPASAAKPKAKAPAAPAAPKKVFVTAEMLEQRLALNGHAGAVELAHNEFLTPNAQDLAARKHMTVRKAAAPCPIKKAEKTNELAASASERKGTPVASMAASGHGTPAAPAPVPVAGGAGTFGIVVEGGGPAVDSLLRAIGHEGLALADCGRTNCWMTNTREMCNAVAAGQLAGGVAVLPHGADAMVLANKVRGVRAVQGTRPASVAAAIRHFGANVLILEHAFSTFHEMRQMVRLFVAQRESQAAAGALMTAVTEMEQ